jgi:hypothetical protein
MATTEFVIAIGIIVMGAAVALVAVVSIGIRREERLFRERRQLLEEQGNWPGQDVPRQFFQEVAPDWVCRSARATTGLWVRRTKGAEPEPIPWYERRP